MFFFAGAAPDRRKASHASQDQVTTGWDSMVKVGSGGSRVIVDSVRAPGRELELENTLFSRFVSTSQT